MISTNFQVDIAQPWNGGLIATVMSNPIKGMLLWSLFLPSIGLLFQLLKNEEKGAKRDYGAAIILGFLLLNLSVSQATAWTVFRFGKLLVIPFFGWMGCRFQAENFKIPVLGVLVFCYVSQFVFIWYIAKVFFT